MASGNSPVDTLGGAAIGGATFGPIGEAGGAAVGASGITNGLGITNQDPQFGESLTTIGGPGTPLYGANLSVNGMQIPMLNPGMQNPSELNPWASESLMHENSLYGSIMNSPTNPFNTDLYQRNADLQGQQISTMMGNQYARMGLAGSSAELGGMNQSLQNNQMAWQNRQQSDQQRTLGELSGLNNQIYGQASGIQNQYGNYQDTVGQDILGMFGMGQQQDIANQQAMAGMFGSLLGAGGMAAGGALKG